MRLGSLSSTSARRGTSSRRGLRRTGGPSTTDLLSVYLRLRSPVSTPGNQQGLAASVLLLVITIILVVMLLAAG
jgi:hypothetical protein